MVMLFNDLELGIRNEEMKQPVLRTHFFLFLDGMQTYTFTALSSQFFAMNKYEKYWCFMHDVWYTYMQFVYMLTG